MAGLTGQETVVDAYCGIGTISLFLAQKAKKVYGVEIVPEAIEDARYNARQNGFENVEFFCGKSEDVILQLFREQGLRPDVMVVDPPRSGCEESLLETIRQMAPDRVVYVSCDPATLARDLNYLCHQHPDYELQQVQGVCMFPQTSHVETVCLMSRVKE
jgi:23S rRNA (uracil1939-C5)-methyltransferase